MRLMVVKFLMLDKHRINEYRRLIIHNHFSIAVEALIVALYTFWSIKRGEY